MSIDNNKLQMISEYNARIDRMPKIGLNNMTLIVIGLSYYFAFYGLGIQGYILSAITEEFNLTPFEAAIPISLYLLS